jgi:hypothetical protein
LDLSLALHFELAPLPSVLAEISFDGTKMGLQDVKAGNFKQCFAIQVRVQEFDN